MAKIITGYTGEPHVTSDDASAFQQGIVGMNDYCLYADSELTATSVSGTKIQLSKAEIVIQGTHIRLEGTETVNIEPQTAGTQRIDYIVARYLKNAATLIESVEIDIVKGTETTSSPIAPALTQDDIRNDGYIREVALFAVTLSSSVVQSIIRVIPVCDNIKSLTDDNTENKKNISTLQTTVVSHTKSISTLNNKRDFTSALRAVSTYAKTAIKSWLSTYDSQGKPNVLGAGIYVQDANGADKASLRLYSNGRMNVCKGSTAHNIPIIKRGTVNITPSKVDTNIQKSISYGVTFAAAPVVFVCPHTSIPGKVNVSTSDIGTSKCNINLTRSSITTTAIDWVAIGLLPE